jgi:ferredoxin
VDRTYERQRRHVFTVAVNCMVAGGNCFCVSMETGPRCTSGYDLVLTEILEPGRHEFVLEAGSEAGERVLSLLPGRPAADDDLGAVDRIVAATASNMGRFMDTEGIKELLYENLEHPRWNQVAERCLSCTNCTLVCPTCFCWDVEDATTLDGKTTRRTRVWDSCFNPAYSAQAGGNIRPNTKARYRQWLTHKMSTWVDQFGVLGCVGCGRCITWCPAAIDITEEIKAIRVEAKQ